MLWFSGIGWARLQHPGVVNIVMNLRVPYKERNLLGK
jgi:hypothetical protein